jgi:integral membrane protein
MIAVAIFAPMQDPIIRRFRTVAIAEGVSFILLLFIAMPLKHFFGMPMAVKVVGWAHGALFIAYWVAAVPLFTKLKWDPERIVGLGLASVLPFGTFVLERKWLR